MIAIIIAVALLKPIFGFDFKNISEQQPPLAMDIEWVMQGHSFSFQGFFVEFLGLSSGIRKIMPMTRLVQSSFKTSFNDSAVRDPDKFFKVEMFPREGEDTEWLHSVLHPPNEVISAAKQPVNKFVGRSAALAAAEGEENLSSALSCDASHFIDGALVGGELSKYLSPTARSAEDCCRACVQQPACVSWTYATEEGADGCRLKGTAPISVYPINGAKSGIFSLVAPGGKDASQGEGGSRSVLPRAIILHGTTCVHRNVTLVRTDPNTIVIGRYMVERAAFRSGITKDEYAVMSCASRVDEIWVPTEWHRKVFTNILSSMGFPSKSIAVIPESVDVDQFDPAKAVRKHDKWTTGLAGLVGGITADTNDSHGDVDSNNTSQAANSGTGDISSSSCSVDDHDAVGACTCIQQSSIQPPPSSSDNNKRRRFEFLSVFKWEHRKGWDVLLDAYWQAFDPSDAVTLRLRTYVPEFSAHLFGRVTNVTELIANYAMESLGKELHELPRVVWETGNSPERKSDSLTRAQVRDLLASADAFVLPTRGEGWGLPIAEAMAMELPVLVTNYSGPTAFCTDESAYLIPVRDELDKEGYAQPDPEALRKLMHQVVEESVEGGGAFTRGKAAREVMRNLSPVYVASLMAQRLRFHASMRGWDM